MGDDLTTELQRCNHHTAQTRGQPCPVWECVIRARALDEIERLRATIDELCDGSNSAELAMSELLRIIHDHKEADRG